MQKVILLLFFSFFSKVLAAQPNQLTFDHYSLNDGFNSREAMDVVTTPNGMVWISSNDGLVRFDSKRFKFYQHIEGDRFSLANNYCKGLATDKRGHIWIQSDDNLDVFDPTTERFAHIRIPDGSNITKPVYPISFAYNNEKDIMWIGTTNGLYYSTNGSHVLQPAYGIVKDSILLTSYISNILIEGSDVLWITASGNILKLNIRTGNMEKYNLPEKVDGIYNGTQISSFSSAYLDGNKTLWLGCMSNGLVSFNTITKTFHQYIYRDYLSEPNLIIDIAQTRGHAQANTLWLSTAGFGFASFDIVSKKFTSYSSLFRNDPHGIYGTTYGIFTGDNNGMWIGSSNGLHYYDYSKQIFNTINISSISKGKETMPVGDMVVQQNKNHIDEVLWFHVPYIGCYIYNLIEKKVRPVPAKLAAYLNKNTQFVDFFIDSKNILWISSVNQGLTGYDIDNDAIIYAAPKPFGESGKWVTAFFEDQNKQLWIGSRDGLYMMDVERKKISAVVAVNQALMRENLSQIIQGITQDELGNIWFIADGTDKQIACIAKYNPESRQLNWVYNEENNKSINHIQAGLRNIVYNGHGKILVSFYGESIIWYSTNDTSYVPHVLGIGNGLKNTRISSMTVDQNGNNWSNSSFGFSCFKEAQNTFTNYSFTSYPLDNTAEPSMYLSPQSGNMYVGQVNAIRFFNTNISKTDNLTKAGLVFSEIEVLNKPFYNEGRLITDGDILNLNSGQNMVNIEFALLNYTNTTDHTYSWILQGWDKEWITSQNNMASYINLRPGTYTLLVKAANSQGEWTEKSIKLTIVIAYPVYQTWWFILLCSLALSSIVYWLINLRFRYFKEKFQLRNKIAADLHDEIGSTLTSINILSNVSQQAMEQYPQQAKGMLQQISDQSKTIQQNMSDIVWSIRPDNEKVEDLVTRMREYAAQTLEHLNIDATIEADEELGTKILPMQHRKELLLIYKEAINNVAKHAGATIVSVSLKTGSKSIELTIKDNGKWKGETTGTGTRSMQARAGAIGGNLKIMPSATGTEVLVSIPVP